MPEEQQILICCRVANSPGYVVLGSLPMKCHECNKAVWVSPASMLLLHDNPKMQIKCTPCTFAHMSSHRGTSEIIDLTPAQMEELEEYYGSRNQ